MKALRVLMSLCLSAALLFVGYIIESKLNEYRTAFDTHIERSTEVREGRKVDFTKLKADNPDTRGWIWLPDTNIDYPIVQGENNDYYVHHDFDGTYLFDGCIFIDANVDEPFREDYNTVIYGHRMVSGAMFNNLGKFQDKEFFDNNSIIIIETENASYDLHVIAYCEEKADSDLYTTDFDDGWHPFTAEQTETIDESSGEADSEFAGVITKKDFIELVRDKAVNLSDEEFDENDIYVTLSTCAYSSGDNRNQIIGILKDAARQDKVIEVKTEKPLINKWLILQIIVGIFTVSLVILLFVPKRKGL